MSLLAGLGKLNLSSMSNWGNFGKAINGGGGGFNMGKLGELGSALGAAGSAGYTPYTATTVSGTSKAADPDKKALDAQYQALDMTRANTNMGINDAEAQNLNLGINRVNQNTAARSNALKQEAAGRGLGGSGMDFALRAQNEQTGANAANEAGIEAQQTANQRALTSIAQLGALGGDLNDQAFNRGQAEDAFNQFNAAAKNAAATGNAGNQVAVNQGNLGNYTQNRQFAQNAANQRRGQNIQMAGALVGAGGAVAGRR